MESNPARPSPTPRQRTFQRAAVSLSWIFIAFFVLIPVLWAAEVLSRVQLIWLSVGALVIAGTIGLLGWLYKKERRS